LTLYLPHSQTQLPILLRFSFYGERVFARKAASSTIGAHICLFLWHVDHLTIGVAKGLLYRCDCCTVLSEGGFM
jgi:hypothetical protein